MGRVVAGPNQAVLGAIVFLSIVLERSKVTPEGESSSRVVERTVETGPEGEFRFELSSFPEPFKSKGIARLLAQKGGLESAHQFLRLSEPAPYVQLRLPEWGRVQGWVFDPRRRPLEGAKVLLTPIRLDSELQPRADGKETEAALWKRTDVEPRTAEAGVAGSFSITHLPAGVWKAEARQADRGCVFPLVHIAEGRDTQLTFIVPLGGGRLTGLLTNALGNPLPDQTIQVVEGRLPFVDPARQPAADVGTFACKTNVNGEFQMEALPFVSARLSLPASPRYRLAPVLITLVPDGVTDVRLIAEERTRLEGRVVDGTTGKALEIAPGDLLSVHVYWARARPGVPPPPGPNVASDGSFVIWLDDTEPIQLKVVHHGKRPVFKPQTFGPFHPPSEGLILRVERER
jgi:hypothetical protein